MAGLEEDTEPEFECPICTAEFVEPKVLPCYHLVCRSCVLTWLQTKDSEGRCPLCRERIVGEHDGEVLEATLPQNISQLTAEQLENISRLTAEQVGGGIKEKGCLWLRLSTREHSLENREHNLQNISQLKAEQLASHRWIPCKTHRKKQAEVYCAAHQELICLLCNSITHKDCCGVVTIAQAGQDRRTELKNSHHSLQHTASHLAQQIKEVKDTFQAMRTKAMKVFDDLQVSVEKRRQQVNDVIMGEEDVAMSSVKEMERIRAAMVSQSGNVGRLVTSAPDDAILDMMEHLTSRQKNLETRSQNVSIAGDMGDVVFHAESVTRVKSELSKLGDVIMPQRQRRRSSNAKASPDVDPQSLANLRKPTLRVMAKLDAATITTESEPSASGNSPQANGDDGLELTVDPSGQRLKRQRTQPHHHHQQNQATTPNSLTLGTRSGAQGCHFLSPSETGNANSLPDFEGSAQRPGSTSSPSEAETSKNTNQLDPEGPVQRARKTSSPPVPSTDANASNLPASDGAASSPSAQTQTSLARDQPDPEGPAQRSRNTSSSSTSPPADAEAATLHASLPTPPGERSGSSSRSASTSSLDVLWERPGSGARTSPSQRQLSITTSTRSSPSEDSAVSSDETQASKPRKKALARILRVGIESRGDPICPVNAKTAIPREADWGFNMLDVLCTGQGKAGTVTARPSELAKEQGVDPTDWVDVRWDAGGESCYRMGLCGRYDLDLA